MYVGKIMKNINPELKEKFVRQFVYEAGIKTPKYKHLVYEYLRSENNRLWNQSNLSHEELKRKYLIKRREKLWQKRKSYLFQATTS